MANRLQRDQIVVAALDAVDSPSLDEKERPSGSLTGTLGTGWLQRALDFFYKVFPIKGVLTSTSITLVSGTETVATPADFLIDYPDGIILADDEGHLARRGLAYLLSLRLGDRGTPTVYCVEDSVIRLRTVPDKNYTATLYYYKLPAALGATDIPPFPDDQILTDFLEIRYKEWLQKLPKGSAIEYMRSQVVTLQKAGVGNEPEPDQIPFDRTYYGERWRDPGGYGWLGDPVL